MRKSAVIAIVALILVISCYPWIADGIGSIIGEISNTGIFVVDSIPPQFLNSSQNTSTPFFNDTVELNASFSENVQINKVYLYVKNSTEEEWRLLKQYSLNYTERFGAQSVSSDIIDFDNGNFVFYVYADNLGVILWKVVAEDMSSLQNSSTTKYFTVSAIVEDDSDDTGDGGGTTSFGGGSGTIISLDDENIELKDTLIALTLLQGDLTSRVVQIKNNADEQKKIYISEEDEEGIISFSREQAVIDPNAVFYLTVDIHAPARKKPGNYVSKLIIKDEDGNKQKIYFVVSISLTSGLFDIKFDIENDKHVVEAGGKLYTKIYLINFGPGSQDVTFHYEIMNLREEVIEAKSETFAVHDELAIEKEILIPSNMNSGKYILVMSLIYEGGKRAIASDLFEVRGHVPKGVMRVFYFIAGNEIAYRLIMFLLAVLIFATVFYFQLKKDKENEAFRKLQEYEIEKQKNVYQD